MIIQMQKNWDEKLKYIHLYAFDAQEVNKIIISDYRQNENSLSQIKNEMQDKINQQQQTLTKFKDFQLLQFLNDKINRLNEPVNQFQKIVNEKSPQLRLVIYSNFMKIHNILQFYENYVDQLINLYYNVDLLQPLRDKLPKSQVEIVQKQREEIQTQINKKGQVIEAIQNQIRSLKDQEFRLGQDRQNSMINDESCIVENIQIQLDEIKYKISERSNKLDQLKSEIKSLNQQVQLLQTQMNQNTPEVQQLQNQISWLKPQIMDYQKQYIQILQQKDEAELKYQEQLQQKESYKKYIESQKREIANILQQQTISTDYNYDGNNLVFKEFTASQIHLCYFGNNSIPQLKQLIVIHSKIVEFFIESNKLQRVEQDIISLEDNNLNDMEEIYDEKNKLDIQIIKIYLKQKERIQQDAEKI
ncbi:hypothetical protein pb186bvf_011034 [Paramecium bursaria]